MTGVNANALLESDVSFVDRVADGDVYDADTKRLLRESLADGHSTQSLEPGERVGPTVFEGVTPALEKIAQGSFLAGAVHHLMDAKVRVAEQAKKFIEKDYIIIKLIKQIIEPIAKWVTNNSIYKTIIDKLLAVKIDGRSIKDRYTDAMMRNKKIQDVGKELKVAKKSGDRRDGDVKPPANGEGRPVVEAKPTASVEGRPVVEAKPNASVEGRVTVEDKPAANVEGRPVVEAQPTSSIEGRPVIEAKPTSSVEGRVTVADKPAANGEGHPVVEAKPSADVMGRPVVEAKPTASVEGRVTVEVKPATNGEGRPVVEAKPTASIEGRVTTEAQPTASVGGRLTVEAKPAVNVEGRPVVEAKPRADNGVVHFDGVVKTAANGNGRVDSDNKPEANRDDLLDDYFYEKPEEYPNDRYYWRH
ncbi:unnamed protein product [Hyaloperonospora brassicae]|uniref:Uncharacterized protein n=1 Tax=Hyaloperonospora brassicae TaxID=162125 RepID=A0AAV0T6D8_HYABA|nr:unnamed protein product [Hyaloperonospora brassicae]